MIVSACHAEGRPFEPGILASEHAYSLSVLKKSERYGAGQIIQETTLKQSGTRKRKSKNRSGVFNEILKKLNEGNQKILNLTKRIEKKHRVPIVLGRTPKIRMLQEFTGEILESLQVISGASSKVKVRAINSSLIPQGAEFRCFASAKGIRIKVDCDRMITKDKNYKIEAYLKDHYSGAETLYADQVYSYEEEGFIKKMFAGAIDAAFDVSKDRILTTNGEVERKNARNKVLSGAMGATSEIGKRLNKDINESKTILTLNAGKKVIITFDEEVKL